MNTPMEWNVKLGPKVRPRDACAEVERAVRVLCEHDVRFSESTVSTADLVEMLYPASYARGDESLAARQRIFRCLFTLATRGLSDCCTKGAPVAVGAGKPNFLSGKRPWLWHKPTQPNGERHRGERLNLKGCPPITLRPDLPVDDDADNEWIDQNFDAVLWFLKAMTKEHDHGEDTKRAA